MFAIKFWSFSLHSKVVLKLKIRDPIFSFGVCNLNALSLFWDCGRLDAQWPQMKVSAGTAVCTCVEEGYSLYFRILLLSHYFL